MEKIHGTVRKPSVLLVDDEESVLQAMRVFLDQELDLELTTAHDGDEAILHLQVRPFDLVVCDQNMPLGEAQGTDVLRYTQEIKPQSPLFILVTAYGTIDMAVQAMRSGAYDFIKKPFEKAEFISHIRNALGTLELAQENRALRQTVEAHYVFSGIIAVSKVLRDVLELARRAAEKNSAVLILGESGTGKDLLARAIHFQSGRRSKPFIPINCGAIPENLIESEFFGHKKGAFTGADSNRRGCFEEVAGGTIFLDEIGEMPLDLQVKLLRVLEERKIRRIGENVERPVDFRILAATNRSLADMVKEGRFRQDLFYRLNVLTITIPPLRDRREDIIPLAENFLKNLQKEMHSSVRTFTPEALAMLQAYDYPGNVRELINILQRAVLLCDGDVIGQQHLPEEIRGSEFVETLFEPSSFDLKDEIRKAQVVVEQRLIRKALKQTEGNHKKAAELLGISRGSLYNKLQQYGI